MSHRSFIEGRPNHLPGRFLRLVLSLILLMTAMPVYGQLSDADISALQQQAIDEGWTFTVSKNPATDRLLSELCGIVEPANWRTMAPFNPFADKVELPPSFDWRAIETLPPPRDQGQCGSCWAFATVGALECNIAIQDGLIVDLSEQWLLSCNLDGWSCDGGWFAHDYHQWKTDICDSTGAPLEVSFPYTANGATCTCYFPHPYMFVSGLNRIGLSCFEPTGAFYAFPSIQGWGLSSEEFAERLLQEQKVAVVPGNVFGASGEGFLRCSYATSREELIEALDRMETFISGL